MWVTPSYWHKVAKVWDNFWWNWKKKVPKKDCIEYQEDKIMTTEEIHSFNTDNEDIEIVKDFAYLGSVNNLNGDWRQEIRRRLRLERAAMKELGKIIKSKDVSLETKAKIIHILVFPITMYGGKSWTVKKAGRKKKWIHFKCGVWRELYGYPGQPERWKWSLEQVKPKTSLKAKMTKLKLSTLGVSWEGRVLLKRQ